VNREEKIDFKSKKEEQFQIAKREAILLIEVLLKVID